MEDSRGGYGDKKGRDNLSQSQNYNNSKGKGGNNISLQKSRSDQQYGEKSNKQYRAKDNNEKKRYNEQLGQQSSNPQLSKTQSGTSTQAQKSNSSENRKEITEDEVKSKMVNYYKSFFIKNEADEDDYSDEEGRTPG